MPFLKRASLDIQTEKNVENIRKIVQELTESEISEAQLYVLLEYVNDENEKIGQTAVKGIGKVFGHLLQTRKITLESKELELYNKAKECLLTVMKTSVSIDTLELCLDTLLKLLANEGKYPYQQTEYLNFPGDFLKSILWSLLRSDIGVESVIAKFKELLVYNDVKYYTMKFLLSELKERRDKEESLSDVQLQNIFCLMLSIRFPILGQTPKRKKRKPDNAVVDEGALYCEPFDPEAPKFVYDYDRCARMFSSTWLAFLSFKLPFVLYRKILVIMDERIMPHFHNPLTLSDFLINSFDIGGAVSLLALSSLFILIQKCGLEYPDFYPKFYSLLEPNILHVKYRARFFFWADIFLSSTHLPEYLVAAFIKKLSRLLLLAPVDAILIILPFILNLLVRHPSLSVMVNNPDHATVETDPFDEKENDLANCNALKSSLWEVQTLLKHWHPKVVKAASFVQKPIPTKETDLSEILEIKLDDLTSEEYSKYLTKANIDRKANEDVTEFWNRDNLVDIE